MKFSYLFPILPVVLSACEPSTLFDEDAVVMLAPQSGQTTVAPDGAITTTLSDTLIGQEVDDSGNGFSFVVGTFPDVPGTGGFAGLTAATNLGSQPAGGTASMTGTYRLARLDNLALNTANRPQGSASSLSENITLTADFIGKTLTGTQNDFSVNGSMNDGVLSGTVNFDGLDGTLVGEIGATEAVGSFTGSDANTVYAGGFFVRE